MSLTILEVLENANYNLKSNMSFQVDMGKRQLENALFLINEKDKELYDKFDEGDLED